jgi:hypothetical protein
MNTEHDYTEYMDTPNTAEEFRWLEEQASNGDCDAQFALWWVEYGKRIIEPVPGRDRWSWLVDLAWNVWQTIHNEGRDSLLEAIITASEATRIQHTFDVRAEREFLRLVHRSAYMHETP